MLSGDGRLHKAVTLGSRVHIIEELQVFPQGQPVQNLLLDSHAVSGPHSEPSTKSALPPLPKQDGKLRSPDSWLSKGCGTELVRGSLG